MQKKANFEATIPGKWILAGEHSVLRGFEALVFPLSAKYLQVSYYDLNQPLEINIKGEKTSELELIIWSVLERAFKLLNLRRDDFTGLLVLDSHIALGGGMGASATLCVAITKWLNYMKKVETENMFYFARELENLFHGESSGVDVAVTLQNTPLVFTREKGFSEIPLANKPYIYLSYSGVRGVTKDCVEKVKQLFVSNLESAKQIDQNMADSVQNFKKLLIKPSDANDFESWVNNFNKANGCFADWSLLNSNLKEHQESLIQAGAKATKVTGSGGGGYVLSLWNKKPDFSKVNFELIPCFNYGE